MTYMLEVQAPGGAAEEHELACGAVTVGSAEQARVRVATPSLPPWLVALEVRPEVVDVRWHGAQPQLVFEGAPLFQATVPWGAEVFAGGVRLSFLATAPAPRRVHPLLLVGLVGGLFWLAWQGGGAAGEAGAAPPVEAPRLAVPSATCPEPDAARARGRAENELLAASAKRDRYPFDASEGVEALQRLELSRACFELAGDAPRVATTRASTEALEQKLNADYAALRLQLDRATEQERPRQAIAALQELDALVAPLGDTPYRTWLRRELRRLQGSLSK